MTLIEKKPISSSSSLEPYTSKLPVDASKKTKDWHFVLHSMENYTSKSGQSLFSTTLYLSIFTFRSSPTCRLSASMLYTSSSNFGSELKLFRALAFSLLNSWRLGGLVYSCLSYSLLEWQMGLKSMILAGPRDSSDIVTSNPESYSLHSIYLCFNWPLGVAWNAYFLSVLELPRMNPRTISRS